MGASADDRESFDVERPQHEVTLSEPYAISRFPVTRSQFATFVEEGWKVEKFWREDREMGIGGEALEWWRKKGNEDWDELLRSGSEPVTGVSWFAAMAYCRWLGALRDEEILLPTEAQWECAVRAGAPMAGDVYPWGSGDEARNSLPNCANMDESAIGEPSVVGAFQKGQVQLPNEGRIDDMIGNVLEWCLDERRTYEAGEVMDPLGPLMPGAGRVLRGGSYWLSSRNCRAAYRSALGPASRGGIVGFRLVRVSRQAGPPAAGGQKRSEVEAGRGDPRDAGKDRAEGEAAVSKRSACGCDEQISPGLRFAGCARRRPGGWRSPGGCIFGGPCSGCGRSSSYGFPRERRLWPASS